MKLADPTNFSLQDSEQKAAVTAANELGLILMKIKAYSCAKEKEILCLQNQLLTANYHAGFRGR